MTCRLSAAAAAAGTATLLLPPLLPLPPLPLLPAPPAAAGLPASPRALAPPAAVDATAPPDAPAAPGLPAPVPAPSEWRAPVNGPVSVVRPFEPPPGPYAAGHRGTDLAADPGDGVLAAGRGVVSFAGPVAGRGVVVVVHPDGLRTSYEPVRATVPVGTPVVPGSALGTLETSRHCAGPCLHWGLRDATGYRDPMNLLDPPGAGRVRLLPLDTDLDNGPDNGSDDGSDDGSDNAADYAPVNAPDSAPDDSLDSPDGRRIGVSASRPTVWCAGRASPWSGSGRRGSPRRRRVRPPRRE